MISLVLGYALLFVTVLAILGVVRIALSGARSERYLAESGSEAPLPLDHLPSAVRRFVTNTRLLRISLEGPLFQVAEYRRGALDRRVEDPEDLEHTLTDAQRAVGEWVREFEGVARDHGELLDDAGLTVDRAKDLADEAHGTFSRERLLASDGVAYRRFVDLVEFMRKSEDALARQGRIYR